MADDVASPAPPSNELQTWLTAEAAALQRRLADHFDEGAAGLREAVADEVRGFTEALQSQLASAAAEAAAAAAERGSEDPPQMLQARGASELTSSPAYSSADRDDAAHDDPTSEATNDTSFISVKVLSDTRPLDAALVCVGEGEGWHPDEPHGQEAENENTCDSLPLLEPDMATPTASFNHSPNPMNESAEFSHEASTPNTVPATSPTQVLSTSQTAMLPNVLASPESRAAPAKARRMKSPRTATLQKKASPLKGTGAPVRRRSNPPAPGGPAPVRKPSAKLSKAKPVAPTKSAPSDMRRDSSQKTTGRSDEQHYEALEKSFLRSRTRIQELEKEVARLRKEKEQAPPPAAPSPPAPASTKAATASQEVAQLRERIRHLERLNNSKLKDAHGGQQLQDQLRAKDQALETVTAELNTLKLTAPAAAAASVPDDAGAAAGSTVALKEKECEVQSLSAKVGTLQQAQKQMEMRMTLAKLGKPMVMPNGGSPHRHADPAGNGAGAAGTAAAAVEGDLSVGSLKRSLKATQEEAEVLRKEVKALATIKADAEFASAAATKLHAQLRKKDAICEGLMAQNANLQRRVRTLQSPNCSPRPLGTHAPPPDASLPDAEAADDADGAPPPGEDDEETTEFWGSVG